jgi:hypothetical protein
MVNIRRSYRALVNHANPSRRGRAGNRIRLLPQQRPAQHQSNPKTSQEFHIRTDYSKKNRNFKHFLCEYLVNLAVGKNFSATSEIELPVTGPIRLNPQSNQQIPSACPFSSTTLESE